MKIDKNIPIPTNYRGAKRKYPFNDMEVGDSFFCPEDTATPNAVRNAAWQYGRIHKLKFASKSENGGTRVWRIE